MAPKRKRTRRQPAVKGNVVTPAQIERFLSVFALTANTTMAARAAKFSRSWPYERAKTDEHFAAQWEEATQIGHDAVEAEARRRAIKGVKKPVYQQGKLVGYVREYSDSLLSQLLKATGREKYKDRQTVEHSGSVEHVVKAMTPEQIQAELEELRNA